MEEQMATTDVFHDPDATPVDPAGEPRISYVVARLERAIRRSIDDRVSVYGLTVLQYTTLSVLGRRGQLSNAQLARRAYMSPQAMSEVIEALESKGLIKRSRHPSHRRVYPAALTAKGRKVLAACERLVDELEAEMLSELRPAEQDSLRAGLIHAVRGLRAGLPEQEP
jgi:DNA-binding MarR family transcriptional regulator